MIFLIVDSYVWEYVNEIYVYTRNAYVRCVCVCAYSARACVTLRLTRVQDITQQHLCDPVTVSLIEKCTRFHIHCAHFMCEEPMSSFDAKINNENMTKCLQSLKEMYQDLRNKGVFCASEAEFQGYNVLLNLNKGDILR